MSTAALPARAAETCDVAYVGAYCDAGDRLASGQKLLPGQSLYSPNGFYRAIMQTDGNFVVYKLGGIPVWSTGTYRPGLVVSGGMYAEMQTDGNFVLYEAGRVPVWSTGTSYPGSIIRMQDDCNLVIYASSNFAVWASNTLNC